MDPLQDLKLTMYSEFHIFYLSLLLLIRCIHTELEIFGRYQKSNPGPLA